MDDNDDGGGSGGGTSDTNECLVVCCDSGKPVWIPLQEKDSLVSCAFHPTRKIAAWSHSRGSLQVLDLATSRIVAMTLEEPAAASGSAARICRGTWLAALTAYLGT